MLGDKAKDKESNVVMLKSEDAQGNEVNGVIVHLVKGQSLMVRKLFPTFLEISHFTLMHTRGKTLILSRHRVSKGDSKSCCITLFRGCSNVSQF